MLILACNEDPLTLFNAHEHSLTNIIKGLC